MNQSDDSEQFVQQLTEHQNRIYGYVYSLLGDHSRASDVVQEVNLVLWRKISEFDPARSFLPWAFSIARFQALAHVRDSQRDRLLIDTELAQQLGAETEKQSQHFESVQIALRSCMQQLSSTNRTLIEDRYFRSMKVSEVAKLSNRTASAVKVALLRARQQLAECVQNKVAVEDSLR
jgi:RNA polymerase sigma-70 factor (ECF subfamily)